MSDDVRVQEQLGNGSPVGSPSGGPVNIATGQGTLKDTSAYATLPRNLVLEEKALEAIYAEAGLARKLCRILPEDALSRGIRFPNMDADEERGLLQVLDRVRLLDRFREAASMARLTGDAYLFIDDGQGGESNSPIGPEIVSLPVFSGYDMIPDNRTVNDRFGTEAFGEPTRYLLRNGRNEFLPFSPQRIIRFTHIPPPPAGWKESQRVGSEPNLDRSFCGLGIVNTAINLLMQELEGRGAARKMLTEGSVLDLEVPDVDEILDHNSEASSRLSRISTAYSVWGMFVHPSGTTMSRVAVNLSGLSEVLESNITRLAVEADIPNTRFTGSEVPGLSGNAGSEASSRRYDAKVGQYQRETFDGALSRLMPMLGAEAGIEDPETLAWQWPSWLPTRPEEREDRTTKRLANIAAMLNIRERLAGSPERTLPDGTVTPERAPIDTLELAELDIVIERYITDLSSRASD